jgi:hypothetical protein
MEKNTFTLLKWCEWLYLNHQETVCSPQFEEAKAAEKELNHKSFTAFKSTKNKLRSHFLNAKLHMSTHLKG